MLRKIDNLSELETVVLRLVGRYRLVFSSAVKNLAKLDSIEMAESILRSLVKKRLLVCQRKSEAVVREAPFYFLSDKGVSALHVVRDKRSLNGPHALSNHLSILWHCAFENRSNECTRVENSVVAYALGASLHRNCLHLMQKRKNRVVLLRVYRPEANLAGILKRCNSMISKMPEELLEPLNQGDYGIVILMPYRSAINQVRRQLGALNHGGVRLHQKVRIEVSLGPTTTSFETAYRRMIESA